MAKGQLRSNKEAKKPKQNKPKKAAGSAVRITEVFHGSAGQKPGKPAKR